MRSLLIVLALAMALSAFGEKGYLFSYFSDNPSGGRRGEAAGLHLAWSFDGLNWTALNNDQPILVPALGRARLMRDPCVCRGPDETFHLVWTTDWTGGSIGYASTRDFVNWTPQRELPVMADEPTTRNCWAPELTYDPKDGLFYLYWSSTIPDRHSPIPDMDKREAALNHRIYRATTRDFETFSPSRLWFNPDYSAIDASLCYVPAADDWLFFVKNENHTPLQKNLRMMRVKSLAGDLPSATGEPLTGAWTEGPSALWVDKTLYLYFDLYKAHAYGVLQSLDGGRTWTDVSDRLRMPRGMRHGTAFEVDRSLIYDLLNVRWEPSTPTETSAATTETHGVTLAGLTMGAEKLLRYGEKVRIEGELTYLVSDGADFHLTMDANGELKVVAVPSWWTPARVATALVLVLLLIAALLGWALVLRHQKKAEARVNEAVQKERLRLSRDLHDGYQQLLAGCMFRLTAATTLVGKNATAKALAQLEGLRSSLTHAQAELRAALWTMTEEAEGPAAVADLFRYASSRLPHWEGIVSFETEGVEKPITRRYAGALLMILQEAVGNAIRHGGATSVRVKVVFGRKGLAMIVRDNGCGFDLAAAEARSGGLNLGLSGMRSRAEKIGGRFAVRAWPGRGAEVRVILGE